MHDVEVGLGLGLSMGLGFRPSALGFGMGLESFFMRKSSTIVEWEISIEHASLLSEPTSNGSHPHRLRKTHGGIA